METPKITVNEALIIAKEYHLEAEVTECIKQGMSPIEALIEIVGDSIIGTIENLNNKLKQICDDIRTISES